ncbi:MAG: ATP-binding protein [Deltaproteobacteria bacterium]|nr:ATP-binding protein [Deltaproteobacteria bacterium]
MELNWEALDPNRPLEGDSSLYVSRPGQNAEQLAAAVRAGRRVELVVGPTGIGKSTELARAAHLLTATHAVVLVRVDRETNMRETDAATVAWLVARETALLCARMGLSLPKSLADAAALNGLDSGLPSTFVHASVGTPPEELAVGLVAHFARTRNEPLVLFLDGLEKAGAGLDRRVFGFLGRLGEHAAVVTTLPWRLAYGASPVGEDLVAPGEHHFILRPLAHGRVEQARFFLDLAKLRLGGLPGSAAWISPVLEACGGIPRTFQQLLLEAHTYARIRGARTPERPDVDAAIADLRASFRRALRPGDYEQMRGLGGTDGRAMDLDRRVRLLSQGLMLEVESGTDFQVVPHPLVLAIA